MSASSGAPWWEGDASTWRQVITSAEGPAGRLPFTEDQLRNAPSGDLFGWTQNAGMGWSPDRMRGPEFLVLSTQGGMRSEEGRPIALGYHTGHFEVGLLVAEAARTISEAGGIPFAAYVSDPCDGRSQGTTAMFDSLAYRNDAAIVMRRLIRSLPTRRGVVAVATCDKGLPAAMMALAGCPSLPVVLVPGGVTLPPRQGEDAGKVQTIGARFAHGEITLDEAARAGCAACASPGGGCQFLGTAATSQVVAEALGLTVPHAALAPSGQPIWQDVARRSATALMQAAESGLRCADLITDDALYNAMAAHAACGGSTNLLLHIPAIAFAAGRRRPTVEDWESINRQVPRFVDVLPNGPRNHPTVRLYLAGGVPEVMLWLRRLGILRGEARTITGASWNEILDWWETSDRRRVLRERLQEADGIDPDDVILPPDRARAEGMTSTVCFPRGNLCPEGSVIKATAIDPSLIDDGVYRHEGPARVFVTERAAIAAIKGTGDRRVEAGDVVVLIGRGPMGSGMEETYQITSALKFLPWGKHVAVVTDARFSGVSTGACIGHVGPEALAGGPIGKVRDGDRIRIVIDQRQLAGSVDLVGTAERELSPDEAQTLLAQRTAHPELRPDEDLPADTRLWAALQALGGGTWGGCVYDVEEIERRLPKR